MESVAEQLETLRRNYGIDYDIGSTILQQFVESLPEGPGLFSAYLVKRIESDKSTFYDPSMREVLCECGHAYYRHFDSYQGMSPVGCKYCHGQCNGFVPIAAKAELFIVQRCYEPGEWADVTEPAVRGWAQRYVEYWGSEQPDKYRIVPDK